MSCIIIGQANYRLKIIVKEGKVRAARDVVRRQTYILSLIAEQGSIYYRVLALLHNHATPLKSKSIYSFIKALKPI